MKPPPEAVASSSRERAEALERALRNERSDVRTPVSAPAAAEQEYEDTETVVAFMGGASRRGRWEPPAHIEAWACMGGITLDFRDADLLEGTTDVHARAMWGGINVIVPPDVNVAVEGQGLLGGFEGPQHHAPDPDAPTIRVRGLALMAGVAVRVMEPKPEKRRS